MKIIISTKVFANVHVVWEPHPISNCWWDGLLD